MLVPALEEETKVVERVADGEIEEVGSVGSTIASPTRCLGMVYTSEKHIWPLMARVIRHNHLEQIFMIGRARRHRWDQIVIGGLPAPGENLHSKAIRKGQMALPKVFPSP